jgi:hypothetical protein
VRVTETEDVCDYCRLPIEIGFHSPDWCLEWAGPERTIRVPLAGSMMLSRPSLAVVDPPPLPVSLGPCADGAARDRAHGDRLRLLAAGQRPGWLPRPHVLPAEELADLMAAEAAGVGHEALEVAVYYLIEAASDARRDRLRRRHTEPAAEPGLSRRRIAPCARCGRPGAVPGRVLCGPCRRELES